MVAITKRQGIRNSHATKKADTQDSAAELASLLGRMTADDQKPIVPTDWLFAIRKGFSSRALDSFGQNINATDAELAKMLGLSVRTLARRRRMLILTPNESDRLYRLARVVVRAGDVFDHRANGLVWLRSPNAALGGLTPMSMLDTDIGTEIVKDLLGRIEYGVFS
ncbi:type II RES/Xre toxin-antitoxin system antitoxin [Thiobacillus denitrificans]|uniref:type II RES/Xre toxin-antitoxin system antitoxin n=1 Tax=Thiobacillus denitrificans TaxID=36861 RepID=UPI0002EB45A0|nr:antitoxin Xre-like helix-turn-helix domain-containing protein [Thiobacillus denitrificans]